MDAKFTVSEVFRTSWKHVKSEIWVLAGLLIGYLILSLTLSMFAIPAQSSVVGTIVVNLISAIISILFTLGYTKNMFQTLDGIEPQFSAYGQQSRKIVTYFAASVVMMLIVLIGFCVFILPGIYLTLRLQFYQAFIVEEDAGILESLKRSWKITEDQVLPLFLLFLATCGIILVGVILLGVGILFALPVAYMMYCEAFRRLNTPLQVMEEESIRI